MAQRLRTAAVTSRLDSMDMNRKEFGRDRTDPSEDYLNTPNEPVAMMNGSLVKKINIFSTRAQALWYPGVPLMFNTDSTKKAAGCRDIFEWQMMMYEQSVQLALERMRIEAGTNGNKRFMEKVEDSFRSVDIMAATWRYGGTLFAEASPYGRDGPYENNFNYLEGQVLSAPVCIGACMYMTNLFKSHREIPINASLYMILKKVRLERIEPPSDIDGGLISMTPTDSGNYKAEDRCMIAVFVWKQHGVPEDADAITQYECLRDRKDPPLESRSYLDFATDDKGQLVTEAVTKKTRPVIKSGQIFFLGKTLFKYTNKSFQQRMETDKIQIPILKSASKVAGEQLHVASPYIQRLYC